MKLSNLIYKLAKKHKIPARIYAAILMLESRYQLKAKGCHFGILQRKPPRQSKKKIKQTCDYKHFPSCKKVTGFTTVNVFEEVKICSDFGISQIYYKTAKSFKFNINRLTTDLSYSVEAGAIVLSDFKRRYSHREFDWWTRYNASSRSKRNIYRALVQQYL